MKKLMALALALAIVLSLCACSNGGGSTTAPENTNTTTAAQELSWPEKEITIIIGWAAGGGNDLTVRAVFQPYVEKILGKDVVITYKEGSGGDIAYTELLKNTKADGYTLAACAIPGFLTSPMTKSSVTFKLEDAQPIANLGSDPNVFVVEADSQFSTLQDVIDYAKANPGDMTVAIGNLNADDDLALGMFTKLAGIEVNKITYEGGASDRITAQLGKHIQMSVLNASEVSSFLEAGQIKVLGVMSEERVSFLSSVPTFKEEGFNVIHGASRGVIAPAGVDKEIVKKLSDAIGQAMKNPECVKTLENMKLIPDYMDSETYTKFLQEKYEAYKVIVEENKKQ